MERIYKKETRDQQIKAYDSSLSKYEFFYITRLTKTD